MSTYLLKCVPPHLSTLHAGGEALFEEECSEDEVAEELAPLTVQLGYVLARLGRLTEAQEMYEQVWGSGKVWVCVEAAIWVFLAPATSPTSHCIAPSLQRLSILPQHLPLINLLLGPQPDVFRCWPTPQSRRESLFG